MVNGAGWAPWIKLAACFVVMTGLDPAIHVFLVALPEGMDARDKPGHDERKRSALQQSDFEAIA